MATLENKIRQQLEQPKKAGVELDATCHICLKTKFADGVGHICHYCKIRCCARCGGKVTLRSNKVSFGHLRLLTRAWVPRIEDSHFVQPLVPFSQQKHFLLFSNDTSLIMSSDHQLVNLQEGKIPSVGRPGWPNGSLSVDNLLPNNVGVKRRRRSSRTGTTKRRRTKPAWATNITL